MLLVCSDSLIFSAWTCRNKTEAKDYPYQMAPIVSAHQFALLLLHLAAILHQFSTQALSSSQFDDRLYWFIFSCSIVTFSLGIVKPTAA